MSNLETYRSPLPLMPVRLPAKLDRVLSIAHNALVDGLLPERSMPNLAELTALGDRMGEISAYLRPATREGIARHVARLFNGLSRRTESQEDEGERLMVYLDVLAGFPEWAMHRACEDFLYGRRGDRKWLPSAAEIRPVCAELISPWVMERERIERVVTAETVNPNEYGERAKNLKHAAETIAILRGDDWKEPRGDGLTDQQRAEKWLAEYAKQEKAPITISNSLRKNLASYERPTR